MSDFIQGQGSKSGSIEKNTLFSDTMATAVLAYSSGPVLPLGTRPDGSTNHALKSLYFGDTPLMNGDRSLNFDRVKVQHREGNASQEGLKLPAINKLENIQLFNVEVKKSRPFVHRIDDLAAQAAEVTIGLPQGLLDATSDNGDVKSTSVEIAIDLAESGGGFGSTFTHRISGKTDAQFLRGLLVFLSPGTGPWDIRVRRLSNDNDNIKLRNTTMVSQVDVIKWADLTYPRTALIGVSHLASSFGGSAQISVETYGRIIRVPTGYDPVARSYPEIWDGTFKTSWTDNPVWVALDLLTDPLVGLGLPDSTIDLVRFYDIAKYCDQLVDDGNGGKEPRYTFNGQITRAAEPAELLPQIASIWRGYIYAQGSLITATCDKPTDPALIVNPANVIDGRFTWSTTSKNQRASVFKVRWIDPARGYKEAVEVVTDPDLLRELGYKEHSIDMPYCTSQGQANRAARWGLYTQQYETEVVTYQAGLDHFLKTGGAIFPGQIILLRDPAQVGTDGLHGRLKSATADRVVLDRDVTFEGVRTYALELVGADGVLRSVSVIQHDATTLLGDFDFDIPDQAVWLLTWNEAEAEKVRVLSVQWEDKLTATITAVKHNPSKYAAIESDELLDAPSGSLLPTGAIEPASNIEMVGSLYSSPAGPKAAVAISWQPSPDVRVDRYDVEVLRPGEVVPERYSDVLTHRLELENERDGDYTAIIRAKTSLGAKSVPLERTQTLTIFGVPPGDVQGFDADIGGGQVQLTWNVNSDVDMDYYELRYSPLTKDAVWGGASVYAKLAKEVSAKTAPARGGTYMIKAVDTTGNTSINMTSVIIPETSFESYNVVAQFKEDPAWAGTFDGTSARTVAIPGDNGVAKLVLLGSSLMSGWTSLGTLPTLEGYYPESGYYEFVLSGDGYFDLGQAYETFVSAMATLQDFARVYTMDQWGPLSGMGTLTGDGREGATSIGFEISTTLDNPLNSTAVWTSWATLTPRAYAARAFRVRIKLSTQNQIVTPVVSDLEVTFDMEDRVVALRDQLVPPNGTYIAINPPFKGNDIHITQGPQNLPEGAAVSISNKSRNGFNIKTIGTDQNITIDLQVRGFGEQQS